MPRYSVRLSSRLAVILLPFLVVAFYILAWNHESLHINRGTSVFQNSADTSIHLIQIISPFVATEEGDDFYPLDFNQWIAMESIRRSMERAPRNVLKVDLICAVSSAEQWILAQAGLPCHQFVVLNRSTRTEYPDLEPHIELPFISDMIDGFLELLRNATFHVIIMNSDIGVSKDFYSRILTVLKNHDSFSINRVTIPMEEIQSTTNSSNLLQQVDLLVGKGARHPGYDFFGISDTVLKRISFGDLFLGRPPWGANVHLMLQIMADNYINIKSSPFGTFHLGNDMSRWKGRSTSSSLGSDMLPLVVQGFCPSKNAHRSDALAFQNEVNCGVWFLGGNPMINSSRQTENRAYLPGFVRFGFEHIFWNRYEAHLKFDSNGLPHDRNYETPKGRKSADGPFRYHMKRQNPEDPLQYFRI